MRVETEGNLVMLNAAARNDLPLLRSYLSHHRISTVSFVMVPDCVGRAPALRLRAVLLPRLPVVFVSIDYLYTSPRVSLYK